MSERKSPRKNVRLQPPASEVVAAPVGKGARKPVRAAKPAPSAEQLAEQAARRAAQRERLRRGFAKFVQFARTGIGLSLALGLAGALAFFARGFAQQSSRFAVQTLTIEGNSQRSSEQLAFLAGLSEGTNIFTVHTEDARAKLLQDPWIESAEVTRRLPSTVSVSVVERKAAALVALGDTMLATREGEVFKRVEAGDPIDLPVVTCLDEQRLSQDPEGVRKVVVDALELLAEYDATKLARRYPVEELCARADGSFALVVGKDGLSLRLGPAPYRRKLAQAERVLFELERRRAKADVVMLDNEARPDRVVVRVR